MMDYNQIKETIKKAVPVSLEGLAEAHPGEHLNGYALCTDDCVMTLYHVGCTKEWVAASEETYAGVSAVEWEYEEGRSSFRDANAQIVAAYEATRMEDEPNMTPYDAGMRPNPAFDAHVDAGFASMVNALKELKAEGVFSDDVLLMVVSTDPSDHMEELAQAAVRDLNTPELYELWKESVE